jgi:LysM repeat protein
MRRIIFALLLCFSSAWTLAQDAKPLELAPDAPDRYIVVPGDTLWGISSKFLKDPYRWSELWKMNPEDIKNPHRIYPGQVLLLDKSGANPELKFGPLVKATPTIYSTPEKTEIPSIPAQVIEPYLTRPLVAEVDVLENTPRIVALQENRLFVTAGDKIYAKDLKERVKNWQIYRPGKKLVDPDSKEVLGYEAEHVGNALLIAEGDPATLKATASYQEIARNDRLTPTPQPVVFNYVPRAPERDVKGRILDVAGSVVNAGLAGQLSIVTLSVGKQDGLEPGHVLAAYSAGPLAPNRFEDRPETHRLPDQRMGLMIVFRVFNRVSYAMLTRTDGVVTVGDIVRKP